MTPRRLSLLAALATFSASAGLLRCSTDEFSGTDAGTDAPVGVDVVNDAPPAETGPADVAVDTASDALTDADAGPLPKCDRTKAFDIPTKLTSSAQDILVDGSGSFRIDSSEAHAYVGHGGFIKQYDVSGTTLTYVSGVPDVASSRGFGVSDDGLELLYTTPPANVVRMTRASLTSQWGGMTLLGVPLPMPDGATTQNYFHPSHLEDGPTFYFGQFSYGGVSPSQWSVFRAAPGDAAPGDAAPSFVASYQSELHASNFAYTNAPVVTPDDLIIYFARWGNVSSYYPRIARASRANAQAPWGAPTDVLVAPLPAGSDDTLFPFAVTPDECALYFGYNQSIDGSVSTSGPFTVYVARRPK